MKFYGIPELTQPLRTTTLARQPPPNSLLGAGRNPRQGSYPAILPSPVRLREYAAGRDGSDRANRVPKTPGLGESSLRTFQNLVLRDPRLRGFRRRRG